MTDSDRDRFGATDVPSEDLGPESVLDKAQEDALVGTTQAGRYRIDKLLGRGGMGAVYLAEHVLMHKPVAMKVLRPEMTALADSVARFEREAVASAMIEHPNVVNATDFGRLDNGSYYLVLAYVNGVSLSRALRAGAFTEKRTLDIMLQIADALAAAHAVGIVHRDLKPDNVMLVPREDGTELVKVLDFGIAKIQGKGRGESTQLTQAGTIFGTPDYMSPEQACGKPVDSRADLYALGVILYEMLAGEPPFVADEILVVLTKHLTEPPPPLPVSVSPGVAELVRDLLAKDPEDRVQSAADLVERLTWLRSGRRPPPRTLAPQSRAPRSVQAALDVAVAASVRLRRPVTLAGRQVPVWLPIGVLGLFALFAALWAGGSGSTPLAVITSRTLPLEEAKRGVPRALQDLEALAVDQRDVSVWVALAEGYMNTGAVAQGIGAYRSALDLEGSLAQDRKLLSDVRRAAESEVAYQPAQEFAARQLGSEGVDILFDVWTATAERTKQTTLAKQLMDDKEVFSKASPALKVALELRDAQGCQANRELLPRVQEHGDTRSLRRLQRLQAKSGCGFLNLEDCFSCLRKDKLLASTIAAVTERSAPTYQ